MADKAYTNLYYYYTTAIPTVTSIGETWIQKTPPTLTKQDLITAYYVLIKPVFKFPPQTMRQMWKYRP